MIIADGLKKIRFDLSKYFHKDRSPDPEIHDADPYCTGLLS